MLKGKTILLGVTGGIAAYKAAWLASDLNKTGADIHVIMTKNATEFVSPMTFETLTNHRVSVDTFDRGFEWNVQHVALAKSADVAVIAPATANIIAKMATGIADDMLSTTLLACRCPKLVCPAMNTGMLENPATQKNLEILRGWGVRIVDSESGFLACGDIGNGRLASPGRIMEEVLDVLTPKDLLGRRVLVTAGPTREAMDPVRFLSNHSTGKMGYALATAAKRRGAAVTLVSGPCELAAPVGVERVSVVSAREMYDAVLARSPECDLIIKAAAVADYRPADVAEEKIKKTGDDLSVSLTRNPDILAELGRRKRPGQLLCGFAMETQDLLKNAAKKLAAKNADLMVANSLRQAGAGFGVDTNIVTLLSAEGSEELPLLSKAEVADRILDRLVKML